MYSKLNPGEIGWDMDFWGSRMHQKAFKMDNSHAIHLDTQVSSNTILLIRKMKLHY